jgi:excisionase family DNA binding protein
MADEPNTENKSSKLLKAIDVARRLNISRSLAYQLMESGELPAIKIRKLLRVTDTDLEEYILKCRMIDKHIFSFDAKLNHRTLPTEYSKVALP